MVVLLKRNEVGRLIHLISGLTLKLQQSRQVAISMEINMQLIAIENT